MSDRIEALPSDLPALPAAGVPDVSEVQLLPAGPIRPKDGRGPWFVRNTAALLAASNAALGRGVPIDLDHAIDLGKSTAAAGWVRRFRAKSDGSIWADIEWTPMGKRRLEDREYRYISPSLVVSERDGTVLRIDRAGLTNTPALEMRALCAAGPEAESDQETSENRRVVSELIAAGHIRSEDRQMAMDLCAVSRAALEAWVRSKPGAPAKDLFKDYRRSGVFA
ncbi:phage protease [Palleronia caenipelagi]|uniref:Mu-like prophage I protein n=1 Tax=Palleronia caenipelagi TaxID=2489174 RepID=A0A547Q838_9RHOB|nr:phage protease [Palleronia caenipelagi]TRD22547.1 hypothetical protein FEV53_03790 [Palleronia caenipelagi]